jgi:hypothetical protein
MATEASPARTPPMELLPLVGDDGDDEEDEEEVQGRPSLFETQDRLRDFLRARRHQLPKFLGTTLVLLFFLAILLAESSSSPSLQQHSPANLHAGAGSATSTNGNVSLADTPSKKDAPSKEGNISAYVNPNDQAFHPPSWIQEYIAYHNAHVAFVKGSKTNRTSWLQYYCRVPHKSQHCGGLADRLKGILMGFLFSVIDQRVFLLEEWKTKNVKHPVVYYFEPALIRYKTHPSSLHDDQVVTFDSYQRKKDPDMNKFFKKDPCQYHDDHTGVRFAGNYFAHPGTLLAAPCLPNHSVPEVNIERTLFWTLFRFSDYVRALADEFRGPIRMRNYYVAAHLRTGNGDNWEDNKGFHNTTEDWDKFATCLHVVQDALTEHCGRSPMAYLASDNTEAKEYVLEHTTATNVHAPTLDIMHIGINISSIPNTTAAYDVVVGEFKVLMDSSCLIESHGSGFSMLAHRLSRQADTRCSVGVNECHDARFVASRVSHVQCPSSWED